MEKNRENARWFRLIRRLIGKDLKEWGKQEMKKQNDIPPLVAKVISKTIGYDLQSVEPMSEEETKKWMEENDRKIEAWQNTPEYKEFVAKYGGKKQYFLAPWEREIIKHILKMDDKVLDTCETYIYPCGELCVRTCRASWMVLAGREWAIDIPNETANVICLN